MEKAPKPWLDIANWITLGTTCAFAYAFGWLFQSMGGDTKDFVGGFIVGLVPGYVFSVAVLPLCGLVITAQKSPKVFFRYIVLPVATVAVVWIVLSGF